MDGLLFVIQFRESRGGACSCIGGNVVIRARMIVYVVFWGKIK